MPSTLRSPAFGSAPRWIVARSRRVVAAAAFACVLAAGAFAARAQSACAGLDAPFPAYVLRFASDSFAMMRAGLSAQAVRPTVPVAGWPYAVGGAWQFQYPPAWTLRDIGPFHAWVSDARDASHMLFVQVEQVGGNPSAEELFYAVLSDTVGPRASCQQVNVAASDLARLEAVAAPGSDVGTSYAWVFRWLDRGYGAMVGSLQVTVLARGVYTSYGWNLVTAPEAELEATARDVFGPMTLSFYAAPPGGTERDTDDDGVPDPQDAYPEDPTRH